MKRAVLIAMAFTALAAPLRAEEGAYPSLEAWGEALFFDTNLSQNRTEACATCHDPAAGFSDPRETAVGRAVSLGDDGASLGDRNAPTASYARFSPPFGRTADGKWQGGQFHDGRAATLADQAKGPPLNPIEMGMPDVAAVAARLRENPRYVATLAALRPGADDAAAFDAMAEAIAAYEASDTFAPFDSKYDRFLRGAAKLTDQEELGRLLFFSNQFTNCNLCHQLRGTPGAKEETFSNYQFHNIGVPVNRAVRAANGAAPDRVDAGLLENPAVTDPAEAGKIKVPTLRNVAVTGPYMHNGVFADLRTVILFYNSYNTKRLERHINPETGAPFDPPEVAQNLSRTELETGPALDDQRIDALVAFLKTLTDARYEPLLTDP
ncbi:methylamine utilization protein MauG [Sinirhodobacter ferrireducens]|uniref:Methylamine utilization protein MauG n=1 Tax=Paenirhodobacter ferrireducens TaxID=1215032 RepID=A0A443LA79_9RHOB|nr:cytochrome c peroxidase [Sinirhodobacter ferrireducens]RWR46064.1 methylamine utilization protein MauG [Sinirhodobacter ferrireducens]